MSEKMALIPEMTSHCSGTFWKLLTQADFVTGLWILGAQKAMLCKASHAFFQGVGIWGFLTPLMHLVCAVWVTIGRLIR